MFAFVFSQDDESSYTDLMTSRQSFLWMSRSSSRIGSFFPPLSFMFDGNRLGARWRGAMQHLSTVSETYMLEGVLAGRAKCNFSERIRERYQYIDMKRPRCFSR